MAKTTQQKKVALQAKIAAAVAAGNAVGNAVAPVTTAVDYSKAHFSGEGNAKTNESSFLEDAARTGLVGGGALTGLAFGPLGVGAGAYAGTKLGDSIFDKDTPKPKLVASNVAPAPNMTGGSILAALAAKNKTKDPTDSIYKQLMHASLGKVEPNRSNIMSRVTQRYNDQFNPAIARQHEQANLAGADVAGYFNQAADLTGKTAAGVNSYNAGQDQKYAQEVKDFSHLPGSQVDRAVRNNSAVGAGVLKDIGQAGNNLLGDMAGASRVAGAFFATNARANENNKAADLERQRQSAIEQAVQNETTNQYNANISNRQAQIDLLKTKYEMANNRKETDAASQPDYKGYLAGLAGLAMQSPSAANVRALAGQQAIANGYTVGTPLYDAATSRSVVSPYVRMANRNIKANRDGKSTTGG